MLKFIKSRNLASFITIIIIITITSYLMVNKKSPEEQAWQQVTIIVQNKLKNPKSAEFPPYKKTSGPGDDEKYALLVSIGDGKYAFATHVDSKNEFGAIVRDRCAGIIHRNGDKWDIEKLDFVKTGVGSGVVY